MSEFRHGQTRSQPFEVITRAGPGSPKRDSATAGTAIGAIAAARALLRDATASGCGNPVADFLVYGEVVLVGLPYSQLGR